MKPYAYMIKVKVLLALTYKHEVFLTFLSQIVLLFVTTYFWKAAYNGIETVAGVDERGMLTYSVMALALGSLFSISIENSVRGKIRMGNVAVDYIKPVNIFFMYFAEDIGESVTVFFQKVVPQLIFAAIFVVVPYPASALHFALFLVSASLSYMILWFICAIFALFYFWAIDIGPIGTIKNYIIMILSGSFIPMWFFPDFIQGILVYLPFIYTYQLPLSIYIGRGTLGEMLRGMAVQIAWMALFALLFARLKRRVEKNILVQGG